jgi:hypothetical protein
LMVEFSPRLRASVVGVSFLIRVNQCYLRYLW